MIEKQMELNRKLEETIFQKMKDNASTGGVEMIEFLRKNKNWEQANYVGLYTIQCRVGETYSMGTGQSKTEAKEEAAIDMLRRLPKRAEAKVKTEWKYLLASIKIEKMLLSSTKDFLAFEFWKCYEICVVLMTS